MGMTSHRGLQISTTADHLSIQINNIPHLVQIIATMYVNKQGRPGTDATCINYAWFFMYMYIVRMYIHGGDLGEGLRY